MHETLYDLIGTYGYLIVFLLVGIESLGIPLPGETALITASAFAALGKLNIFLVIASAIAGAILGDNAGYWIGKKGGIAFVHKYGRFLRLDENKIGRMHQFFEKHGAKTVFLGRFISLLRCWAAVLAGVAFMPYGTFMFWNALGGVGWSLIFGSLGYIFGKNLPRLEHYIGQASMAAALLAALVVGLALLARWFSHNRASVSATLSEKWKATAAGPRLAGFRSHHQRLWGYVAGRFARGEYLVIHLTFGFVVSAIVLWIFSTVTEDIIHHDPLTRFDLALASFLHRHESATAYQIFHYLSLAGSPLIIGLLAIIVSLILAVKREWIILSGWLAAFYGGGLLGRLLEAFVQRPGEERIEVFGGTLGLPTGHALGSLIGYGLLGFLLVAFVVKRRSLQTAVVIAAGVLIVAVGFSRLYLGALYFSVMIGMYASGVVWLATCITGIEIARRQPSLTPAEVGLDVAQSAA